MSRVTKRDLESAYERLRQLATPARPRQFAYLREQIQALPQIGESFRTTRSQAARSQLVRQLIRIARDPSRIARSLVGPAVSSAEARQFIERDPVAPLLLFAHAQATWGRRNASRHLGPEGDASEHLRSLPNAATAIGLAATMALETLDPGRPRGRGGARRQPDPARIMAATHILDIYSAVTGRMPSFSVQSGAGNSGVHVKGKAVEFLRIGLDLMGFAAPDATLRRLIEAYRSERLRREQRRHPTGPRS